MSAGANERRGAPAKPPTATGLRLRRYFDAALPLLDASARAWLAGAIKVITPTHHWPRRLLPVSRT
jgi:hypothetical protein